MKTIKILLSGMAVYLGVAMAHGCNSDPRARSVGFTTGATSGHSSATSAASGSGSGGSGGISNPVGDAEADSGSRLKVQIIVGSDGSSQFSGMYDSQRKTNCFFVLMSDANLHCAPLNVYDQSVDGFFADASCSAPVAMLYAVPCHPATSVFSVTKPGACATDSYHKFFATGPLVNQSSVFFLSNGICKPSPVQSAYEAHLYGAEIPPSAFVLGNVVTDP